MKKALLSVSDKTGLVAFATGLSKQGIHLLATGGTYRALVQSGLDVQEVSDYTGFPEMMDGRVKTLHPKIHAGILARDQDQAILKAQQTDMIDLVVVNLYPFAATLHALSAHTPIQEHGRRQISHLVEKIDIGGPTLIRAAAKNHQRVAVVVDPKDYAAVIAQIEQDKGVAEHVRLQMAAKAFRHTLVYEQVIAGYFTQVCADQVQTREQTLPEVFCPILSRTSVLRYGENPHQAAAFYTAYDTSTDAIDTPAGITVGINVNDINATDINAKTHGIKEQGIKENKLADTKRPAVINKYANKYSGIGQARQIQGKSLSFNNIADADTAFSCVSAFDHPACVIVKHANPCGLAQAQDITQAYHLALQTDPVSAYGGIIALNRQLDADTVAAIFAQQFVEVIIAPAVTVAAKNLLQQKPMIRLLLVDLFPRTVSQYSADLLDYDLKKVHGGLLVQQKDYGTVEEDPHAWQVVTRRKPAQHEYDDLAFAWKAVPYIKSNAVIYVKGGRSLGLGAGQTSRVMSARIAALQAEQQQLSLKNAVMASDAFLPFRDGVDVAAASGITAIIQPGGSKRDLEVIAAADAADMAMIFTGTRHFRH